MCGCGWGGAMGVARYMGLVFVCVCVGGGGVWPMVEMRLKVLLITRGVCICV